MKNITLLLLLFPFIAFSQQKDTKLQRKLETLIEGFNGQVGIFVHDLKKDKIAYVNADTVFTTASMVKIPILIGVADKLHKGELNYHQQLIYSDSLLYEGVDILGSFKNG